MWRCWLLLSGGEHFPNKVHFMKFRNIVSFVRETIEFRRCGLGSAVGDVIRTARRPINAEINVNSESFSKKMNNFQLEETISTKFMFYI